MNIIIFCGKFKISFWRTFWVVCINKFFCSLRYLSILSILVKFNIFIHHEERKSCVKIKAKRSCRIYFLPFFTLSLFLCVCRWADALWITVHLNIGALWILAQWLFRVCQIWSPIVNADDFSQVWNWAPWEPKAEMHQIAAIYTTPLTKYLIL